MVYFVNLFRLNGLPTIGFSKFEFSSMNLSKNATYLSLVLLCSFAFWHCADDTDLPNIEGVERIEAKDNGNKGDGSDIEVFFNKQFVINNIEEYRIFAIKANKATAFGLEDANGMSVERYTSVTINETYPVKGKTLTADTKDTDGDLITEGVSYRFAVLTIAKDKKQFQNTLVVDTDDFELRTNNLIFEYSSEFEASSGGLSIDSEDNLYMAEFNVVYRAGGPPINSEFSIHKIGKSKTATKFGGPYKMLGGNAFDADHNLYQSEYFGNRIIKTALDGSTSVLQIDGIELKNPDGIYVDGDGVIFVANEILGTIVKILPDGSASIFAEVGDSPRGITADDLGNLYVSHNHESGKISRISPDGTITVLANVPTFKPDNYPIDYFMWLGYITFHQGSLYVPSIGADQIYRVGLDGTVELFAGSGRRGIPRGGALTANLNRPIGLAFSNDGSKLFISGCTDNVPQHTQASRPSRIWELRIVE